MRTLSRSPQVVQIHNIDNIRCPQERVLRQRSIKNQKLSHSCWLSMPETKSISKFWRCFSALSCSSSSSCSFHVQPFSQTDVSPLSSACNSQCQSRLLAVCNSRGQFFCSSKSSICRVTANVTSDLAKRLT